MLGSEGHGTGSTGGQGGGLIEPQFSQAHGFRDGLRITAGGIRGLPDVLPRNALSHGVVHGAAGFGIHIRAEAAEHGTELIKDVSEPAALHAASATGHAGISAEKEAEGASTEVAGAVSFALIVVISVLAPTFIVGVIVRVIESEPEVTHGLHRTFAIAHRGLPTGAFVCADSEHG